MNYKQQQEKEIKIHKVIELYKKYKNEIKNIKQLSNITSIPTSTLQRYLNNDISKYISKEEYDEIQKWLQNAKQEGLSRGGINSQLNNGYTKDEIGRFNGKKKR